MWCISICELLEVARKLAKKDAILLVLQEVCVDRANYAIKQSNIF